MIIQVVKFIHNYEEHVQKPDAFRLAYQACGDHLPCTWLMCILISLCLIVDF